MVITDDLVQCKVHLPRGVVAFVSPQDIAWASQSRWSVSTKRNGLYAVLSTNKNCYLHREVAARAGVDISQFVDHKNQNTLDNRRLNLRAATIAQNNCNKRVRSDSFSGVKGITFDKRRNKYQARVTWEGKTHWAGHYDTVEEAVAAVTELRIRLHGEFANADEQGAIEFQKRKT